MARSYSNVTTSIWQDADFRSLTADAQRLYFMLLTQPDISSCGLLPITMRRWAGNASDTDQERVSKAFRELCDRRYTVPDWDREEVLVRTFVKWDGGYKVPKRCQAVVAAAKAIQSGALMQVMADELDKLGVTHDLPTVDIERVSNGYREAIDTPRVVVTNVSTTPNPQPTTSNPQPTSHRGTRLPKDWQPDAGLVEWVKSECPAVNGRTETENFLDYWHAKSGKDATKVDWRATYRRWMRTAQERAPGTPASSAKPSTTDQRVLGHLELAQRLAQREVTHAKEITQ